MEILSAFQSTLGEARVWSGPRLSSPRTCQKDNHGKSARAKRRQVLRWPGSCSATEDGEALEDDNPMMLDDGADHLREECGVVGVWDVDNAAQVACYALHALQHRGQEGAGIVTPDGENGLKDIKGIGLVSDIFKDAKFDTSQRRAVGHVRYSTAGAKSIANVQPFTVGFRDGQVAIAHNGNLTNAARLRTELELRGSIFNTSSDTEVILHLMATSVYAGASSAKGFRFTLARRVADALNRVEGAYSLVIMVADQMVVARDPRGFRPLVMGRLGDGKGVVFVSETCALDILGAQFIREIEPGEMVVVDQTGMQSLSPFPRARRCACIFEHIYFSRPSSVVFGRSVYMSRVRFGELLAKQGVVDADAVVPVPESGIPAALGYARESGIPFETGIMRSSYVGRTFIQPSQDVRDIGVKLKLSAVRSVIEGKSLVVIDDSIVRGTTSRKIVRMLREAGAREIHFRIACPPMIGSCYYGVDTPNREELVSYRLNLEETRQLIEADSLEFLSLDALRGFLGDEAPSFCDACLSGSYPVPPDDMAAEEADVGFPIDLPPVRDPLSP